MLYVGRLLRGVEREHAEAVRRLSSGLRGTIVRAQSTQGAEILTGASVSRFLVDAAVRFHALNEYSFELLAGRYGSARVVHAPNPFPALSTRPRRAHGLVVFASRCVPSKGLQLLLDAWGQVRPRGLRLEIWSPTPTDEYGRACMQAVQEIPNAKWRGAYEIGETSMVERAEFLMLPSSREGHSNLLCEAMAAGVVVCGSRIPGVAEHIGDGRGVAFEPSFDDLARVLSRIAAMSEDRSAEIGEGQVPGSGVTADPSFRR